MRKNNVWKFGAAIAGAAILAVGVPMSASAAVTTAAYVSNTITYAGGVPVSHVASWDVDPVVANLSGVTTVAVSGDTFAPVTSPLGSNGIYIAFGGEDFTSQSSSYFYNAIWAQPNGTTTTATRVPLISGAFEDAQVKIVQTYNGIDCLTSPADTSGEQCYIYTFSGWGAYATDAGDPNFSKVPVYFE